MKKKILSEAIGDAVSEAKAKEFVDLDSLTDESMLTREQVASVLNVPVQIVRELVQIHQLRVDHSRRPGHIRYGDVKSYLESVRVEAENDVGDDQ